MGTIQKLSSQVIDYAERVSEMADVAQGKHHQRTGLTTRWLLLPASGAALYALVKSDAFSRPAKEVMDEAKARASELPDDLLSMVRQSTSGARAGTEAARALPHRRPGSRRASRTHARPAARAEGVPHARQRRPHADFTDRSTAISAIFATGRPQGRPVRCHFAGLPRPLMQARPIPILGYARPPR